MHVTSSALTARVRGSGFTLIELVITLAIVAILVATGLPSIGKWLVNTRIRTVAEGVQNGVRMAQAEAIRRNRQVVFALTSGTPGLSATPAANGTAWYAQVLPLVSSETVDQTFYVGGGDLSNNSGMTITGPALICFNSVGRQVTNSSTGLGSATCTAPTSLTTPTSYAVSNSKGDRPLTIQVSFGGQIRICDPNKTLSSTAPDGCT